MCRRWKYRCIVIFYLSIISVYSLLKVTLTVTQISDVSYLDTDTSYSRQLFGVNSSQFTAQTKPNTDFRCKHKTLGQPASVWNQLRHHGACDTCGKFTCDQLVLGNASGDVIKAARSFMDHQNIPIPLDHHIIQMASNCSDFIRSRGYVMQPMSDEEAEFPIAYNILMHRTVTQVERLLRAIYAPQNIYCIHVDKSAAGVVHEAVKALTKCLPNVHIASKLETIAYAGISRLQADLNCMRDNLNSPVKWKYLLNTAGEAYPLKTNRDIVRILSAYNGANDIEGMLFPFANRISHEWKEMDMGGQAMLINTGKALDPPPHNLTGELVKNLHQPS